MNHSIADKNDAKRVFWKCGTCSRTFCYLLDREFGHLKETEERASDSLAGGIMAKGHQCGMLWGATLAVGAEAFRRCKNREEAIALSILASQFLMRSFIKRTGSANCRDITETDFSKNWEMLRYLLFKAWSCYKLAEKWAPEAVQAAMEALSQDTTDLADQPMSCASEVAKKMGASDEEMVMVGGFAGGFGLSGNGCGALAAAIWINSMKWSKEHPGKSSFSNPIAKRTLEEFNAITGNEIRCQKICNRDFDSIEDHTDFIKNGGCNKLIDQLSQTNKVNVRS